VARHGARFWARHRGASSRRGRRCQTSGRTSSRAVATRPGSAAGRHHSRQRARDVRSSAASFLVLRAAAGALGLTWLGYAAGLIDPVPRHSALPVGFSNTIAIAPGIVGVPIIGWPVDLPGTYAVAFALTAAECAIGAASFGQCSARGRSSSEAGLERGAGMGRVVARALARRPLGAAGRGDHHRSPGTNDCVAGVAPRPRAGILGIECRRHDRHVSPSPQAIARAGTGSPPHARE
jgi:hypothetical protein